MNKYTLINKHLENKFLELHTAINYHRTHKNKPVSFINLPYLIDIYIDQHHLRCFRKSTQSGITEYLIVYSIVATRYRKRNIFYVMPTDKIKNQFVDARFNQSVQYSEFYRNLFKDAGYDNKSIKQIGEASIFFAVSNSKNNFTSFPADTYIVDEEDECNQENLEMASERLAMSDNPVQLHVANPSIPDYGIDVHWNQSDKKYWFIKCDCGHWLTPEFFTHIVKEEREGEFIILDKDFEFELEQDARIICDKCSRPVDRYKRGYWEATSKGIYSGRQINQIFGSKKPIRDLIRQLNDGLSNETKLQRLYNGGLGLPFLGQGAKITDDLINECIENYNLPRQCDSSCVIGMDVGKKIHTVIFKLTKNTDQYKMQLVFAGELFFAVTRNKIDISELFDIYKRYNIVAGIIDSRPENRLSRMICQNFKEIWMCDYLSDSQRDQIDYQFRIFKTDRTMSMDGVKEQMILGNILLPKNVRNISGFCDQLKAPTRIFEEKETTNGRYVWREGVKADHYFHACNYANIAKKLLLLKR